jgi:rare lipoprotein A
MRYFVCLIAILSCSTCALADECPQTFSGNASWYGAQFHGKKTASGEIFDMNKVSAAHRTLPLPTKVLVENPKNGKSAIVRVNDRGPYVNSRCMDISRQGAIDLDYLSHGTAYIECTVLPKSAKSENKK